MSDYLGCVSSLLTRMALLCAMLLMPFGMAQASVTAPSAMASGRCSQQPGEHGRKAMPAECTMACAAALPAVERPALELAMVAPLQVPQRVIPRLRGILPDIATPPPRVD